MGICKKRTQESQLQGFEWRFGKQVEGEGLEDKDKEIDVEDVEVVPL